MKLVFTIPENPHNIFNSSLIKGWLNYNRIFFGENCLKVSYNTVYHFYDVYIYRSNESDSNWDLLVRDVTGLDEVEWVDTTWNRDSSGMKIDIVRFWIPCHQEKDSSAVLLPCPFCGSMELEVESYGVTEFSTHDEQLAEVGCKCGATMEYTSKDPINDPAGQRVMKRWNCRNGDIV